MELIKPGLNQNYHALCSGSAQLPITSELFGSDLSTAIKDQTEANKISKQLSTYNHGGYTHPYKLVHAILLLTTKSHLYLSSHINCKTFVTPQSNSQWSV
jgi:hypothetical protein